MAQMKIREIKIRSKQLFTKCWAEASFITVLEIAIFMLEYSMFILLGRFTGAHTADTFMPVFDSFPPPFLISAAALFVAGRIVTAPLSLGIKWYYWQASSGLFMPVASIFVCYSSLDSIKRCIKIRVMTDIRKLFMAMTAAVIMLPAVILTDKLHSVTEKNSLTYILITAGFFAVLIMILAILITAGMRYVPLGYIMADRPDDQVSDIIALSRKRMSGKYIRMMQLYCSFWAWYLLFIFVFPLFPMIPYLKMSTAVFIRCCGVSEGEENAVAERECVNVG